MVAPVAVIQTKLCSLTQAGIVVNANPGEHWMLDLVGLNGVLVSRCRGVGSSLVAFVNVPRSAGVLLAKIKTQNRTAIETILCR